MDKQTIFRRFKTVGFRITITATSLILLSAITGYVGYTSSNNYRSDAETVTSLAKRTIEVFETDVLIYKMVRAEKDFVLTAEDKFKNQREDFSNQVDERLNNLIENSLTQESKQLLEDLENRKVDYDQNFQTAVEIYKPFSATGGFGNITEGETEAFEQVKQLSLGNTDILLAAETNLISKIVSLDVGVIESTLDQARRNSQNVGYISLAAIVTSLFIGSVISYFVIRGTTRSLRSIVERLVSISSILQDSVSQATDVANNNAATAGQLAAAASQQSTQVEEITTTISQTAAAISSVASLAQEGSVSAGAVDKLAQEGSKGAQKGGTGLERISTIVSDAVERIRSLAVNSNEVGNLAGEVTSIADQTNILALNAAIEAARAGEAGRGFAVVADEVRRLAEGSGRFADEITRLINSVVDEAQRTAQSTAEGAKEVTESTEIVTSSLNAFRDISLSVSDANKKIQEIASNIGQQAQSAEQISTTAKSIAKGIEQNSSSARELADAVDKQKTVVAVVEKSLEEVQDLLVESRSLVGLRLDVNKDEIINLPPEEVLQIPSKVTPDTITVETQDIETKSTRGSDNIIPPSK
jgi:methyl-accepting chemotaxis protein